MTREEAINKVRQMSLPKETIEILQALAPELRESEDERVRKTLIEFLTDIQKISKSGRTTWAVREEDAEMCKSSIAYLEKQKENIEKEYVFRPLAGTDITVAAEQAIRKADEGDRLVLAFNGAYIPVRKGVNANKIVDIYDGIIEKQKDASKAIEAVDRIDKYIDERLANAHDMKDSNPDKKYYRGWDDALGKMAGILQDVYSEEKQKEQKPEWSEEDEDMIQDIIASIDTNIAASDFHEMETWLKSLRPQPKRDCKDCAMFLNGKCTKPHWKPSDEQMGALWKIMKYAVSLSSYYGIQKEIESLYNDLNKLK